MNSSGNVSIHIVESELSTIQITQMGTFEGIAIAVAVGIVASIGLVIRGAFIYYIKYKAPKKRQINKLMLHDQVKKTLDFLQLFLHRLFQLQISQCVTMATISGMTITSIAWQTPLKNFVGEIGCYVFWLANMIFQWVISVSGFGMAVYRVMSYHNIFKKNFRARNIERYIIKIGNVLITAIISIQFWIYSILGWEKSILYQFCMDIGPLRAETIIQHQDKNLSTIFKIIQVCPVLIAQSLILGEFLIYVWLLYQLWKHDKTSHNDGIITELTKKERNQKNVITLYGQVTSFFVEYIICIYVIVHITNKSSLDPSIMPVSLIVASTLVAISQFVTSHEMKRFVQSDLLNM